MVAPSCVFESVTGVVESVGEVSEVEVEGTCQLPHAGLGLARRSRLLQQ